MAKEKYIVTVEGGPLRTSTICFYDNLEEAEQDYKAEGGSINGIQYMVTLSKLIKKKGKVI